MAAWTMAREEEHERTSLIDVSLTDDDVPCADVSRRRVLLQRAVLLAGATLTLFLVVVGVATRVQTAGSSTGKANLRQSVGLAAAGGASVSTYDSIVGNLEYLGKLGQQTEAGTDFLRYTNFTTFLSYEHLFKMSLELAGLQGLGLEALIRPNNMTDGNVCPDDEEEFEGLCYRRCQNLTEGIYPIRTSAFSCCMEQPCTFFNSKFTNPLDLCHGLNVGGHDDFGAGCPHAIGDCLLNEEFHLGYCYKKCMVLTNATYPFRSGADSCCKESSYTECLLPANLLTNASFNVGGGHGDPELEEKAGTVHLPWPELAEETTTTTLMGVPPPSL